MLADMGAEVIKIETLPGGDPMRAAGSKDWGGENLFFLARNRNKYSLAVDIRQDAGREVVIPSGQDGRRVCGKFSARRGGQARGGL